MSTLFNSQQNININISYNLGRDKTNKAIFAKKINKNNKVTTKKNSDIDIKIKKPSNIDPQDKDIMQICKIPKTKKKTIKILHCSDHEPQKRYKTQIYPEYNIPTQKKELTMTKLNNRLKNLSDTHNKSIQFAAVPKTNHKKNTKMKIKKPHNKSCMIYSSKKPLIDNEVLISSVMPICQQRRKRAQSATHIQTKNDKIVSKLLNMSLLCSQVGGSQIITQKKNDQKFQKFQKILKQFISSLDMNMIHHMKQDKQTSQQNIKIKDVEYFDKQNKYSLELFNQKATVIQRYWRKNMKKEIVNYYSDLFKKAIYNRLVKEDFSVIQIDIQSQSEIKEFGDEQQQQDNSHEHEQNNTFQQSSSFKLSLQNRNINQQQQSSSKRSLNLARYRQLIQKQRKQKDLQKQQQVSQWSTTNKMISTNLKNQGKLDPKLLDQLIKQSVLQKKWIQEENIEKQSNLKNKKQSQIGIHQKQEKIIETNIQQKVDEIEDCEQYNWNKYAQEHQNKIQWDAKWIRKQLIANNEVMNEYLDCGLDGFGLNTQQYQNTHFKSYYDQPIGPIYQQKQKQSISIPIQQQSNINKQEDIFEISLSSEHGLTTLNKQDIERQKQILPQYVIQYLMQDLAQELADILQKSSGNSFNNKSKNKQPRGIATNFTIIRQYLAKLKTFIISNDEIAKKVVINLNQQLGPTSLEILSYLRIDNEEQIQELYDDECEQDQDQLYVVPISAFQQFQMHLQTFQLSSQQSRQNYKKMASYMNFFHRAIFQCFNECLDYQKPYGIIGRPYQWTTQPRLPKKIQQKHLIKKLNNATNRLLELTSIVSGIIFDKEDSPFANAHLQQQHKQQINQQRLSRMLANQLFDSQQTWIMYNDQVAQLLVEVSKAIEKRIIFEICADIKKLNRRRALFLFENKQHQQNFQLQIQ